MEQCQSLKSSSLKDLAIDESQIGVLGAYSRPGLKLELNSCKITSAGTSALAEVLGRNQGPTGLHSCDLDHSVLASGLRGTSCLKFFRAFIDNHIDNQDLLAITGALRENKGLVDLDLIFWWASDETWVAFCDSLKAHPTLEILDIRVIFADAGVEDTSVAPAVLKSRIHALLDMMKVNMSIHTIRLDPVIASMSFSESRSFVISRRINVGREFVPSNECGRFRTVQRF
jgi:hypothetical protein